MKVHLLPVFLFCFAMCSLAQSPGQTLRGTVTDTDTGKPLAGVAVVLPKGDLQNGTVTNEAGSYAFENVQVGRWQLQFSHLGYESLTLAEVLVESGRETVLNVQLRERTNSLAEVVVKAPSEVQTIDHLFASPKLVFSVEEQFRFPGTNFDPARLAMAYPGVRGENDGTNVISVRGNSPNALQWRLEGVEIVNPNHTANAGTFGDRPTTAGGGVNILSAQLLGSSSLLTGAFPAQYGNALGGIMDMSFRKGNDQRHELIAQAGFIGIEAAVEGPLAMDGGSRPPSTVNRQSSFLMNYRYSFTGLLTGMGVDFGDEATAFQDVAFHVALPGKRGGRTTLFGVGGRSSTIYRSPTDTALIEKALFDIDFTSQMGALGLTHVLPIGKKSAWRSVAVLSALEHERTADYVENGERWERDLLQERKLGLLSTFSHKVSGSHRWRAGVEATQHGGESDSFFRRPSLTWQQTGTVEGWVVQPFFDWQATFGNVEVEAGLHASIYTVRQQQLLPEPRVSMSFQAGIGRASLAYGLHSQLLPIQLNALNYTTSNPTNPRAHHWSAGYQLGLSKTITLKADAYYQALFDVAVYDAEGSSFSAINLTDFSATYAAQGQVFDANKVASIGKGRNYGLDLSLQRYLTDNHFFLLAGSLYRSEYTAIDGQWRSSRFDGRHTLSFTSGREVAKQKNGKTILKGYSLRFAWLGGFRDTPIDVAASAAAGYTVYVPGAAFSKQLDDYLRTDLRFYRKWNKQGRNTMLSLDIQNITGRKNAQYHYFDTVLGKVQVKRQLGLIPILTWRGEF